MGSAEDSPVFPQISFCISSPTFIMILFYLNVLALLTGMSILYLRVLINLYLQQLLKVHYYY